MKRAMTLTCAALVALSGTAVAASAGFASGTYNGKTTQHGPIRIVVAKRTMKAVHYKAAYACRDQSGNATGQAVATTDLPSTPIRNGKVDKLYKLLGGSDVVRFTATFKGHAVTGTLHEVYESTAHHICDSGVVKFTAKR